MNTPETRAKASEIARKWQARLDEHIAKIMSEARAKIADEHTGCRASMAMEITELGIAQEDIRTYRLDGGVATCSLPAMAINIFAPDKAADPEEFYSRELWLQDQV